MMAWFCVCLALGIESQEEMRHAAEDRARPAGARVEAALESDPVLLAAHRGYARFLDNAPDIAAAEEAWTALCLQSGLGGAARQFDEALNDTPQAQALFDQFYDQLACDQGLRRAVESIQRVELDETSRILFPGEDAALPPFAAGMEYLRAHPDTGLRFLQDPRRVKPTPEALLPLLGHFKDHPEVLEELSEAFQQVSDHPLAQTRLFPWWRQVAALDVHGREAYQALAADFFKRPQHFWVWHQRHMALAADAQARAWIRYWWRKVRRTPALENDQEYLLYLRDVRRRPDKAAAAEQRWVQRFGLAPEWPPRQAPPLLPPLPRQAIAGEREKRGIRMPSVERPHKPQIPRPEKPVGPVMPRRPVKPEKPTKPVPGEMREKLPHSGPY